MGFIKEKFHFSRLAFQKGYMYILKLVNQKNTKLLKAINIEAIALIVIR
jgi:hypothetical protein